MELMHVGKMSRKRRFRKLVMTGNLLPGHKKFVSPDPHRASRAAAGEISVFCDAPHRPQFLVQTRSVLKLILLLLVPISTSDYLSCFLKAEGVFQCSSACPQITVCVSVWGKCTVTLTNKRCWQNHTNRKSGDLLIRYDGSDDQSHSGLSGFETPGTCWHQSFIDTAL